MKATRALLVFAAVAASVPVYAVNVVGKWKGHVKIDRNMVPKDQRAGAEKMLAEIETASFTLTLTAKKTYTLTVSGGPGSKTPKTQTGAYTSTSTQVTLNPPKEQARRQPLVLTLSKNGKSMTGTQQGATLTFTR